MKILLVNDYATLTGGAELMTLVLRDGLRQRGHDARIFASRARPGVGDSLADYECFGTTSPFRAALEMANPWAFWHFRQVLATFQPDVVHVRIFLTQLSPLILPLLRNIPSLYHVVWYRSICPLGTKMLPNGTACQQPAGAICHRNHCLPLLQLLPIMVQMRLWQRWRDAFNLIVANSEAVKHQLLTEGIAPVEVIWNGVPIRPQRPPLVAPPTVAFAGRLVREKGVDVLVRAFAQVVTRFPSAQLYLAGAGPERNALEALVTDLGLGTRVSLLGHLPQPEIERHFSKAWVQVVPSRWAEPFGIVAAEAMMRGTAVVASNTGGLAHIIHHGQTGLLVPPGDANALAEALQHLLQNRHLADQMGQTGRQVALVQLSEARCVERFEQVYQTLCQQKEQNHGR